MWTHNTLDKRGKIRVVFLVYLHWRVPRLIIFIGRFVKITQNLENPRIKIEQYCRIADSWYFLYLRKTLNTFVKSWKPNQIGLYGWSIYRKIISTFFSSCRISGSFLCLDQILEWVDLGLLYEEMTGGTS